MIEFRKISLSLPRGWSSSAFSTLSRLQLPPPLHSSRTTAKNFCFSFLLVSCLFFSFLFLSSLIGGVWRSENAGIILNSNTEISDLPKQPSKETNKVPTYLQFKIFENRQLRFQHFGSGFGSTLSLLVCLSFSTDIRLFWVIGSFPFLVICFPAVFSIFSSFPVNCYRSFAGSVVSVFRCGLFDNNRVCDLLRGRRWRQGENILE